jgi:signal transduction histidine kinase
MSWFGGLGVQPWRIVVVAVSGLLVAIIIAGLVGLGLNQSIKDSVETSLGYDVELEDLGQDLTGAAFHLRETHRALDIEGPTPDRLATFDEAYDALMTTIDRIAALGIRDRDVAQPDELRSLAQTYSLTFRPALPLYQSDLVAYERISDRSLAVLDDLDRAIWPINKLGEEHFRAGLRSVDNAAATARLVLMWVVGGLVLAGTVLALAAVRMVSELSRLYARERTAAETLSRDAHAKANFLADIAHELRTPLTVLRTNADVGLTVDRDGQHATLFQEIIGESARMARMLDDLLFLARSDLATLPLDCEQVWIAPFLVDVAARAQTLTREQGANFELHLTATGELWVDRARIEQAVLILVDNAAKYSPAGASITLSTRVRSAAVWIEVADRGYGIPEEELPYVFERFYRADGVQPRVRKADGFGLGLSIARTIVEAHGGYITAARRQGGGTRVSFCLPLRTPLSRPDAERESPVPGR